MTVRLINLDAQNSERSSNRNMSTWSVPHGKDLRWTCWRNDIRNELNPYYFNRVNIHYSTTDQKKITTSYYCIHEVFNVEEMDIDNFNETWLE